MKKEIISIRRIFIAVSSFSLAVICLIGFVYYLFRVDFHGSLRLGIYSAFFAILAAWAFRMLE
mgnify:CR=1 FL=1